MHTKACTSGAFINSVVNLKPGYTEYRISSNKRRLRINAGLDQTPGVAPVKEQINAGSYFKMSKRKHSYDVSLKLKAVAVAEKKSKEAAAREFSVDPQRIREWCSQKEKLAALQKDNKGKRKRLDGGGRKALDHHVVGRNGRGGRWHEVHGQQHSRPSGLPQRIYRVRCPPPLVKTTVLQ